MAMNGELRGVVPFVVAALLGGGVAGGGSYLGVRDTANTAVGSILERLAVIEAQLDRLPSETIELRVKLLEDGVRELQTTPSDVYRSADALRDRVAVERVIDRLRDRLRALEIERAGGSGDRPSGNQAR